MLESSRSKSNIRAAVDSLPLELPKAEISLSFDCSFHRPWAVENSLFLEENSAKKNNECSDSELNEAIILNDLSRNSGFLEKEKFVGKCELSGDELGIELDANSDNLNAHHSGEIDNFTKPPLQKRKVKNFGTTKGFVVIDENRKEGENLNNLSNQKRKGNEKEITEGNELKYKEAKEAKLIEDVANKYKIKIDSMFLNLQKLPSLFHKTNKVPDFTPGPDMENSVQPGPLISAKKLEQEASACMPNNILAPPGVRDSETESICSSLSNSAYQFEEEVHKANNLILEIMNYKPSPQAPQEVKTKGSTVSSLKNSEKINDFFKRMEIDMKKRQIAKENAALEAKKKQEEEELKLLEYRKSTKGNLKVNVKESVKKMMMDVERRTLETEKKIKEKGELESKIARELANKKFFSSKSQAVLDNHAKSIVKDQLLKNITTLGLKCPLETVPSSPNLWNSPKRTCAQNYKSNIKSTPRRDSTRFSKQNTNSGKKLTKLIGCGTAPESKSNFNRRAPKVKAFDSEEISRLASPAVITKTQEYEFFLKKYNNRFLQSNMESMNSNFYEDKNELKTLRIDSDGNEERDMVQAFEINNIQAPSEINMYYEGSSGGYMYDMPFSARSCKSTTNFKFI